MARTRPRPLFDPRCEFVWLKPAKVNGKPVAAGAPVDKTAFTPRRLRQLYAADEKGRPEGVGVIAYAPGQSPGGPPSKPRAVGPSDASLTAVGMLAGKKPAHRSRPRGVPRRRLQTAAAAQ